MRKNNNSGFTIIELIVVSFVIVLIAGAIVGLNYILGQSQLSGFNNAISLESGNRIITQIATEIRTARYGDSGVYLLEYADEHEIVFYSDLDFNGDTDKIRYYLEGTTLYKDVTPPSGNPVVYDPGNTTTKILADNVRNGSEPIFYYYGDSFPEIHSIPLTPPAEIGEVRTVQIVIKTNESANDPQSDYILSTLSHIRILQSHEEE